MQTSLSPKDIAKKLPHTPGIYKFFDKNEDLLYVGKAKDLKHRVSSYFNASKQHNRKTKRLISQIVNIKFVVVNTEYDALLLENNLIKTHQPKYNILLKDDKSYPYIALTNEPFPRVFSTRTLKKGKATYYGPYTNIRTMNAVLNLLHELYTIRTCSLNLTQENIKNKKFKLCLEYHIGNCKAPCEAKQSKEDYNKDIRQVQEILKGNLSIVKKHFKERMLKHAESLEFELAESYKLKLKKLDSFQSKSLIVNPKIDALDTFAIISDEKLAFVHFIKIKNGGIMHTQTVEIKKKLDESDEEVLSFAVYDLRKTFGQAAKEIITNIPISLDSQELTNTQPKIGDKKKLLDLAVKNVMFYKRDKEKRQALREQPENSTKALRDLQKVLRMEKPPLHIECFDNSNIQGTNPVASMVFFKNGKPAKSEYRHYNIKTVVGPDDFASMREIVYRRYKRLLNEKKPLPDLIIIDGGKGQLSSACEALEKLDLYGKIKIIGIAKKLEEIYLPKDDIPLHINKKSPALKLIQYARNEAHRFAIEFHRLKRSNASIHSELENIEGIGEKTITKLLQHFKSVKKIKESSKEEVAEIIGKAKAEVLSKALKA